MQEEYHDILLFSQAAAESQGTLLAVSRATVPATRPTASVTETVMLEETAVQTPLRYALTVRYPIDTVHYSAEDYHI